MTTKPYHHIPIADCGEPLLPIPLSRFAYETPHPYAKLNAPYGDRSPYYLRSGVIEALVAAQESLQQKRSGWKLYIFDAYRPIAVQQFMVEHTFVELVNARGLALNALSESDRQEIQKQVYQFWAIPSSDPKTPPPHSTGAAIDLSLVDAEGNSVDMGSPIDEPSERSFPDYFATRSATAHANRQLLNEVMSIAGFCRHPNEWWHFSLGDQMWAWLNRKIQHHSALIARYGAIV